MTAEPARLGVSRVVAFARFILSTSGRRAWPAAVFLTLGSLTEGLSILLLVPLLTLLGPGAQSVSIPLPDLLSTGSGATLQIGLVTALAGLSLVVTLQALLMLSLIHI